MISSTLIIPLVFIILLLLVVSVFLYLRLGRFKQTEEKQQSFETLFEQQPEAWIIIDGLSLRGIEANQKALNMFGVYRKGLISELQFDSLFRDDLEPEEVNLLLNAVDNNTFINKTLECRSLQGRLFSVNVSISRVYEGNLFCRFADSPMQITLMPRNVENRSLDVSENTLTIPGKAIQVAVTPEEKRTIPSGNPVQLLKLNVIADAVAVIDTNQHFEEVNDAFAGLTGYTIDELHEISFATIIHPSDVLLHEEWFNQLSSGKYRIARTERRILRKDGQTVQLEFLAAGIPALQKIVITAVDNTEARNEHNVLQQTRDNLLALVQNTDEAIFSVDSLGKITVVNHKFQELISVQIGHQLKQGEEFAEALPFDQKQKWKVRLQQVLQGKTLNYQEELKNAEGQLNVFEVLLYPVRNDDKLITGASYYARNITSRIQQERELNEAKENAEQATRAKSEFLAVMSHEIRTPLNGLIGISDLLNSTSLNTQQKEFVDIIRLSGEALLQVISDILDFSKIEANKMQLEEAPFELKSVVDETLTILSGKAKEKGLALNSDFAEGLPLAVAGDKARLRQVLMNLVGNALKFTDTGSVTVAVKHISDEANDTVLQFEVRDTGLGIPAQQAEQLFTAFTQADPSTYRKFGGTGLGLTICKTLVNLMGGKIWVESEPGKGSTFFFTIQVKRTDKIVKAPNSVLRGLSPAEGMAETYPAKILLAEDNDINRLLASKLFARLGYEIIAVPDGKEALNAVKNNQFDLVFMDVQMPEMDGLESSLQIRRQVNVENQPVIIAMTAFASPEDRTMCIDAGMDDYISKPVTLEDMEGMLRKWVGEKKDKKSETMKTYKAAIQEETDTLLDQGAINRLMDIGKQTDPGFLVQVLDMFMAQVPAGINDIQAAYEKGDYEKMWQVAHKIKGTCLNIGARKLSGICREVENKGRNLELSNLDEIIPRLNATYQLTINELKSMFQYN